MSVVAAKVYDNKVVIAADSIAIRGNSARRDYIKLACINDMLVGGVGNADEMMLMYNYMRTHKPATATENDVLTFVIEFSEWKNKLCNVWGMNNEYLFAYKGHLFHIFQNYAEEVHDYRTIGAGRDFAMAALYLGHTPKEAIKTSCDLCHYTSEPIIELEQDIKE